MNQQQLEIEKEDLLRRLREIESSLARMEADAVIEVKVGFTKRYWQDRNRANSVISYYLADYRTSSRYFSGISIIRRGSTAAVLNYSSSYEITDDIIPVLVEISKEEFDLELERCRELIAQIKEGDRP